LEFAVEDLGRVIVVQVRGAATSDQADHLDDRLRSSLRPRTKFVVLDLEGLTVLGPAALARLAEFSQKFGRKGVEVWLAGLQPAVWLALHLAGFDRLFTIRASRAQALTS
jgi:anti-anti-sigma factor